MNNFREVYSHECVKQVKGNFQKAVALYCAVCLFFVCICVAFVLLFKLRGLNVWFCGAINFLVTVSFLWFTVLYFRCIFPKYLQRNRFFSSFKNRNDFLLRATFVGKGKITTEDSVEFCENIFQTSNGEVKLLVLKDVDLPLVCGTQYDLAVSGNRLLKYAEVQDVR